MTERDRCRGGFATEVRLGAPLAAATTSARSAAPAPEGRLRRPAAKTPVGPSRRRPQLGERRPLARAQPAVPGGDVSEQAGQPPGCDHRRRRSALQPGGSLIDGVDRVRTQGVRRDDAAYRAIASARSTLCAPSNSSASSPSFCGAPPPTGPTAARAAHALGALGGLDPAIELDDQRIGRGALSTSRANTTAAAGAPPITEAREPSSAAASARR